MTEALDQRGKRIRAELDEAKRLREEAAKVLADYQTRRGEAEREAQDILAAAQDEARRTADEAHRRMQDFVDRRTARRRGEDRPGRDAGDGAGPGRSRRRGDRRLGDAFAREARRRRRPGPRRQEPRRRAPQAERVIEPRASLSLAVIAGRRRPWPGGVGSDRSPARLIAGQTLSRRNPPRFCQILQADIGTARAPSYLRMYLQLGSRATL